MSYYYKHCVYDGFEEFYIIHDEKIIIERKYPVGSCIIDLLYNSFITLLDTEQKKNVESFLDQYVHYKETGDFRIISDRLIQAASNKVTVGHIVSDPYIKISFQTCSIDILIDYLILVTYKRNALISKSKDNGNFYVYCLAHLEIE